MGILQQCPICKRIQKLANKSCSCGEDLEKAKRAQRFKYHIHYRLPSGKQIKRLVGTSIAEARDADGKRKGQKSEGLNPKTIDHGIETVKRVIWKAFSDGKVSGSVLKTFQNIQRLVRALGIRGSSTMTLEERLSGTW